MEERKYIGNNSWNTRASFDDLTEESQQLISEERKKARNHSVVLKLAADKAADQTYPTVSIPFTNDTFRP
ncbi:hypothetical protein K0M31_007840 [Melipona bicolor]|uniref:Uncharacterized protein n=1 Tax=Melipona bicolor TaxID=60889 RepID=A0AA40GC60_9HYME|nr:hypothetical protein K0M31_007840 [Melipona bicolor]